MNLKSSYVSHEDSRNRGTIAFRKTTYDISLDSQISLLPNDSLFQDGDYAGKGKERLTAAYPKVIIFLAVNVLSSSSLLMMV